MDLRKENNLDSLPSLLPPVPVPVAVVEAFDANEIVEDPDKSDSGPDEADPKAFTMATFVLRESVDSCLISSGWCS